MKIKVYKNWYLVPQESGYDLMETRQATKKDSKETYNVEVNNGYNMQLENAVRKIVQIEASRSNTDCNLSEYIERFKQLQDELLDKVKL